MFGPQGGLVPDRGLAGYMELNWSFALAKKSTELQSGMLIQMYWIPNLQLQLSRLFS